MNFKLPTTADFSDAFAFFILAIVAVIVLAGTRHLFGKAGVTIAVLLGVGIMAMLGLVRTQTRVILGEELARNLAVESAAVRKTATNALPETSSAANAIQHSVGSHAPMNVSELPAWVKNPPHEGTLGAGYCKYVLTSQLYATPEEAEAELNKQLTVDVQQSFTVANSPVEGWSPTAADLRMSGLIKEKVIETVPMKVGEFDTSVQRVSWLIEFQSATPHSLLVLWQFDEAQRRSKLILSALAAISGVMGVSAFVLRRKTNSSAPVSSVNQLA